MADAHATVATYLLVKLEAEALATASIFEIEQVTGIRLPFIKDWR